MAGSNMATPDGVVPATVPAMDMRKPHKREAKRSKKRGGRRKAVRY